MLVSLDKVLECIDVLNVAQADEHDRVVAREDVPLTDPDVVREAVVNAFVHNRWVGGNAPMFTVYSDHLEALSAEPWRHARPSGFFIGEPVPVSQELSHIFLQLHVSERSGRGVPKIVEACG